MIWCAGDDVEQNFSDLSEIWRAVSSVELDTIRTRGLQDQSMIRSTLELSEVASVSMIQTLCLKQGVQLLVWVIKQNLLLNPSRVARMRFAAQNEVPVYRKLRIWT